MSDYIQASWIMQDVVLYNEEIEKYIRIHCTYCFLEALIKLGDQGFGSFFYSECLVDVEGCCVVECWCSSSSARGGQ